MKFTKIFIDSFRFRNIQLFNNLLSQAYFVLHKSLIFHNLESQDMMTFLYFFGNILFAWMSTVFFSLKISDLSTDKTDKRLIKFPKKTKYFILYLLFVYLNTKHNIECKL